MIYDLVNTNIVNVTADAIVLPANSMLKEGTGTSKAIFEAAGRKQLTQACQKIGTCEIGNAVPTLAFDLKAKYIIHAVVPKWIDGHHSEYDLLSSAYLSSLNVADVMGCESIAFPLLASGNNGFDLEVAFQIAEESIESFTGTKLKKAFLVLYGKHIVSIAKEKGFNIIEIPEDFHIQEMKQVHKEKAKKMAEDGKEILQKFLEDQVQKGLNYLKDEKNREKILKEGVEIVGLVFQILKIANGKKQSDSDA